MVLVWENERNDFMKGWAIDSQMHVVSSLEFTGLQDRLVSTNHFFINNVTWQPLVSTGILPEKSFQAKSTD